MEKKTYKTFKDLHFQPWLERRPDISTSPFIADYLDAEQAILMFPNGYGVSVLFGNVFYSDGVDTYELAVLHGNKLVYPKEVCPDEDVLGYLTKRQVTEAMKKVQDLPAK